MLIYAEEKDIKIVSDICAKIEIEHGENKNSFTEAIPGINEDELDIIWPNEFSLFLIVELYRLMGTLKTHQKGNIYNYISFSRFVKGVDKAACDWCSIVNGSLEMMRDTMLDVCETVADINTINVPEIFEEWLEGLDTFCLEHKYYSQLSCEDYIKPFKNKKLDSETLFNIKLFLKLLDGVKQIEKRWCPFKHMQELSFDRDYYAYNSHDKEEVGIVKDLLRNNKKITKQENKEKINNKYKKTPSIFDEFIEYLQKIIL